MPWQKRSYEAIPALSVRGPRLRRSLRLVTAAWMLGVVWMACVSGSRVKILADMLGFDDLTFGLLGAAPFVATFGQLIASLLIERTGLVKYQFIHCAAIHRVMWLAVAAIPLVLPVPSRWAVWALLLILTASSFMAALSSPAWITWMGFLIPRRIRGRFFAYRERLALTVMTAVVIVLGVLMQVVYDPKGPAIQPLALRTISAVFAVAAVFGLADILLFHRIPEVLPGAPETDGRRAEDSEEKLFAEEAPGRRTVARRPLALLRALLLEPLGDRVFRSYVLHGATMTFSVTVSGWYFWRNAMDNLGFSSLATDALFLVVGPVAGIVGAGAWGRAIDRWGRRPILIVGTIGTMLSLLPWLFASRDLPSPGFLTEAVHWWLAALGRLFGRPEWVRLSPGAPVGAFLLATLACVIGGASWPGVGLAQTGIVLGFADGTGRSRYIAASSALISAGGFLGGLLGGLLTQSLQHLQDDPLRLGPLLWNNWHASFLVSVAARGLALFWLVGMPDPGAASVRSLVRSMGANAYNNLMTRLFYPLRVFGWRRNGRPDDRD